MLLNGVLLQALRLQWLHFLLSLKGGVVLLYVATGLQTEGWRGWGGTLNEMLSHG